MMRASFLQRLPLLVLTAALVALAALVCLLPVQPAAAQGEDDNTYSASDVTVVEGGTTNIVVTLTSAAPAGGVAFTAVTAYPTDTAPGVGNAVAADVRSVASALTIAEGATTGNLAVRARKDTHNEGAEHFFVTVTTTAAGWSPKGNVATVTIHDPVRFPPQAGNPSESRAGIGVTPESDNITLYFKVGQAVSVVFPQAHTVTGQAPYTYALGGPERDYQRAASRALPGGLTFNAANRTLSGTPTGVDSNDVTTLGSNRIIHYHVWDDSGDGGPDGDANTEDNHDELRVRIYICPAGSAATANGATACLATAEVYSLEVSHGDPATEVALSPAFDRDTGTYSASVAETVAAVDVSVLPEDLNINGVTMTVNDAEFTASLSGRKYTGTAALDQGQNVIKVKITSGTSPAHSMGQDGQRVPVTKTYTVNVQNGTPLQFSAGRLEGLDITGTVTRDGKSVTVLLISNPLFDPDTANYTVRVPSDLESITFTPTWTHSSVTGVKLLERTSTTHNIAGATEIASITDNAGSALTNSSSPRNPAISLTTNDGDTGLVHYFNLQSSSFGFGGATVEARTYTAGHEISHLGLSEAEVDALRLPKATGGFYNVTYTATGLPEGLYLGQGRLLQGTAAAKTDTPAAVTYTATDETGASVELTFNVSVASSVEFYDADEVRAFKDTIFEYTVGQATPINATLPAADGGHGTLKYGLSYWVKETRVVDGRTITGHVEKSVNDDARGLSFDATTRVLSSDTGTSSPSAKAFYSVDYWAEDQNGARVIASNSITVNEAPSLPVGYYEMTVGQSVSVTLPEAEGGTRVGIGIRYDLGGADLSALGLSFNGRTRVLSGTPLLNSDLDLTYTATDRNGVTASVLVQVDILPGATAPSSAPDLSAFNAATESGRQIVFLDWADVARATGYVVQVIPDDGTEFPDLAVNVLPREASLTVYDSQTDLGGGKTAHALITGLLPGDYLVGVTAKNADGVGPWSDDASFTVPAGGL